MTCKAYSAKRSVFLGKDKLEECKTKGGTYLTPGFIANLMSGMKLVRAGHTIHLSKKGCYIAVGGSKTDRIPVTLTDAGFEIEVEEADGKSETAMAAGGSSESEMEEDTESESEEEESEDSMESEEEESEEEEASSS